MGWSYQMQQHPFLCWNQKAVTFQMSIATYLDLAQTVHEKLLILESQLSKGELDLQINSSDMLWLSDKG